MSKLLRIELVWHIMKITQLGWKELLSGEKQINDHVNATYFLRSSVLDYS
jgi:hypothetical protein